MPDRDLERRIASLEGWRRDYAGELRRLERDLREHIRKYEPLVDKMEEQERVSQALSDAARTTREIQLDQGKLRLTFWQVVVAAVVACTSVASVVLSAVLR